MRVIPPYHPPHPPYLPIAHMDDEVIAVDKPANLLSVPGKTPDLNDCVESRAQLAFGRAFIVHRLDMATSGLILLARTKAAQRSLSMQFEAREISKTYHALVQGDVAGDGGEVDLPLRADWPNRPLQMVCHEQGKPSRTLWEVVERRTGATLLRLTPVTGRSHQLRVHMRAIGHPIVGDPFYGCGEAEAPRLMLHASSIAWRRKDGATVTASAPHPF